MMLQVSLTIYLTKKTSKEICLKLCMRMMTLQYILTICAISLFNIRNNKKENYMMENLTMLSAIILVSILSASVMLTLNATMNGNKKCKAICIIEALAWLCVVVRMVLASTIANIVIN